MANQFRKMLESGKRMLGTHVNLTDYRICEILGRVGFDYLWIDMEHLSTDFKTVEAHLIAAKATDTPCIVRVSWNEIPSIKKVIEMGPDAIVVPMINSVEEAKRAIDTCIYPPEGKRGFGPCRAVDYGMADILDYVRNGHKEMCRFLQVEDYRAVEIMEQVAQIPYMDGFVIGPMDLSGSVNELGCLSEAKKTGELIEEAIQKAHACGKPIGFSIGSDDPGELERWISMGVDFISASTDMWSVIKSGMSLLKNLGDISSKYPRSKL